MARSTDSQKAKRLNAAHGLLARGFHQIHPGMRWMKHDNPVIVQLAAFLEAGAAGGAWGCRDYRLTAAMLFNAVHGAVDEALAKGGEMDRASLMVAVKKFCRAALGLSP